MIISNKYKVMYVLGTKAQFIKSKYILLNLVEEGIDIKILDTGQHKEITEIELINSGLIFEYTELGDNKKNISSIFEMIWWFIKIIFSKKIFLNSEEISYSLIHGDTASTLIGLFVSKKYKIPTIHLESGYKSYNLLRPFPEEIIRNIVSRFSDILVVDGDKQFNNVEKYAKTKDIIKISRNTIYDSISEFEHLNDLEQQSLLTITIHRTENIYNKKRLLKFIKLLKKIEFNESFSRIQWFCHDITHKALVKYNLLEDIRLSGIELRKLVNHKKFVSELQNSNLIITDGGSITEECSILGLNTIIWRDVVENEGYLNKNVILSNYDEDIIIKFINNLPKRSNKNLNFQSPSQEVVREILKRLN